MTALGTRNEVGTSDRTSEPPSALRSSAPRTDICFDGIQEPVEGDAVVTDVLRSENEMPLFRIRPPKQEPAGRMCDTPQGFPPRDADRSVLRSSDQITGIEGHLGIWAP